MTAKAMDKSFSNIAIGDRIRKSAHKKINLTSTKNNNETSYSYDKETDFRKGNTLERKKQRLERT